ncbi:MAG: hypothetical protein ACR2KS_02635 [Candidatus Eremiobacter antarcticus]|nr:hypothetical protein [Candidatus Eremiobacteraeota bacterium]
MKSLGFGFERLPRHFRLKRPDLGAHVVEDNVQLLVNAAALLQSLLSGGSAFMPGGALAEVEYVYHFPLPWVRNGPAHPAVHLIVTEACGRFQ